MSETTITSKELSRRRRFVLDKIAKEMGFATFGRLSTHIKRAYERADPVVITIGSGKGKQVLSTKGLTGSQP